MTRTCRLLGVVLAASLAGAAAHAQEGPSPPGGAAPPAGRPVIGPERTGWFKAALLSTGHPPPPGWSVTGISIGERAEVRLAGPDGATARVGLRHPTDACADCPASVHFRIDSAGAPPAVAAWVRERLDAGAADGDPWTAASPDRTDEGREPEAGAFEKASAAISSVVNDVARLGENLDAADLLAVLWCVLLVLLAREVALAARGSSPVRLGLLLALAGGAFAVRAALATSGPGDLHMNLFAPSYGLGSAGLLRVLGPVLGSDPLDLVWVGMTLGSLAPPLLALAMREVRPGWVGLVAGAVLAFHPLMVRFGGEANRQSYVAFLGAAALLALSRPARAALVAYAIAAVLLLNTRPEAVVALPAFWLWSFVARRERPWSAALAAHAIVAAVAVARWLMPGAGGAGLVGSYAGFFRFDTLPFTRAACVWVDPDYTPAAARWLSVAGVAYGFLRAPRLAIWAIVAAAVVLVPASNWTSGGMAISSARYQTFAFLPLAVLAALGVEAAWAVAARFRPVAGTVAAALACVWLVASTPGPMARICVPRTVDLEYRFVLETLPTLPRGAIV
ncbi:MAG: hypothetical protein FJ087_21800, partial [Deltaproteobacteria bacterium]|nr:hypothetical protein [Deltaproteobacteria bacterium]